MVTIQRKLFSFYYASCFKLLWFFGASSEPHVHVPVLHLLGSYDNDLFCPSLSPAKSGEVTAAIQQGLTSDESAQQPNQPVSKEAIYTMVLVTSTLEKFQLKLFSKEPHLVSWHAHGTCTVHMASHHSYIAAYVKHISAVSV